MERDEILQNLRDGLKWEYEFIVKYDSEDIWKLFKVLDEDKFKRLEKLLKENINDSRRHANMIKNIIDKIESGDYEL